MLKRSLLAAADDFIIHIFFFATLDLISLSCDSAATLQYVMNP